MKNQWNRVLLFTFALLLCVLPSAHAGVTDPAINAIGTYPFVNEPIEISIGIAQSSYVVDYENNKLTRLIEEKTGVDLTFVVFPEVDAETKLLLMITAGTELPDVLTFGATNDNMRNRFANAGALYPLDAFFDRENGIAEQYYRHTESLGIDGEALLNVIRSTDGHIYGMPTIGRHLPNMYDYRAWINQDWLDALNMEMPTTIDELTEMLIAFRDQDPNGNGINDEVPMSGSNVISSTSNANPLTWLQNLFIYRDKTGNGYLPLCDTDGALEVCYDKAEYREFLKYVNMLVRENLLDEAAFSQNLTEMRAQLQAETQTIGMMFGSANGFGNNIASWQPLEQPEGFYGQRIVSVTGDAPSVKWIITKDCDHPELAFLLGAMVYDMDTFGPYFWNGSARFGEFGVDWRYADENEVSVLKELGVKPFNHVLNITWGTTSDAHYQIALFPEITGNNYAIEVFDGNEAYGERLHGRSVGMNMKYAPDPTEVVGKIVYTDEEVDTWSEVRTTLMPYIQEASARFCVGQLDPASDADWAGYLKELDILNYQGLLEMDRIAYNRTMGIE